MERRAMYSFLITDASLRKSKNDRIVQKRQLKTKLQSATTVIVQLQKCLFVKSKRFKVDFLIHCNTGGSFRIQVPWLV